MNAEPPVLIVGAGPTGLVLALVLQRWGVRFRIIDQAEAPGTTSRALVVHARTLEFYRQLGLDDTVIRAAQKFGAVNLWVEGRRRAHLAFGDIGGDLSRYPYSLIFPQDEHERVLVESLRARGIEVERGTELVRLQVEGEAEGARATLRGRGGAEETLECRFLAGCDGARSAVRAGAGIDLPGGTYSHYWYVADVEADGPIANGEVNIAMTDRDVLAVFPMKGPGAARLVGQSPAARQGEAVRWEDVDPRPLQALRTTVRRVNWFSTYRVHHRVAAAFRKGPVFLLGDAAHLHSPVGGQGMNTGIGDAVNLGWKLGSVLRGAPAALLDSYAPERVAFARKLVATTDRVFVVLNSNGIAARLFRTRLLPLFAPALLRGRWGRRLMFRLVSQIAIEYRDSALSAGRVGRIHAGDRLPWVQDNFAGLAGATWTIHVYGTAAPELVRVAGEARLPLETLAFTPACRRAGLKKDAYYLIRPDQHVACAGARGQEDRLRDYVTEWRRAPVSAAAPH